MSEHSIYVLIVTRWKRAIPHGEILHRSFQSSKAVFLLLLFSAFLLTMSNVGAQEAPQRPAKAAVAKAVDEAEEVEDKLQNALPDALANDPQIMILQQYVRVHCALARRVCDLNAEQEQLLAKINGSWLKSEMKKAADSPVKLAAAGIARFLGGRQAQPVGQNQPHEIIALVKTAVDGQIESTLDEKQLVVYRQQRDSRETFRREALAEVLVSALDRHIYLTEEQRDSLQPAIAKWLKKDLYWQFYFQNGANIPDIPQTVLSQVLETEQLDALKGFQLFNLERDQIEMQMVNQQIQVFIEK